MQIITFRREVFYLFEFWHILKFPIETEPSAMVTTTQFFNLSGSFYYRISTMCTNVTQTMERSAIVLGKHYGFRQITFQQH